jgi:hypothetical protein
MAATAAQLVCSSERRAGATVQCECVPRKLQVYRKALQGYLVVLYLLTVCPGAFRACVRAWATTTTMAKANSGSSRPP